MIITSEVLVQMLYRRWKAAYIGSFQNVPKHHGSGRAITFQVANMSRSHDKTSAKYGDSSQTFQLQSPAASMSGVSGNGAYEPGNLLHMVFREDSLHTKLPHPNNTILQ